MRKLKMKENGITLMVLVVTIIILLILATVTVSLTLDDKGVIGEAKEAVNEWERVSNDEEGQLSELAKEMRKLRNGTTGSESGSGNTGDNEEKPITEITGNETENVTTQDKLGNKIVIPAGFKVINSDEDVTKGIIIEDESAGNEISKGNQYVWIPVSHVNGEKTNTIKDSEGNEHTVELARYIFDTNGVIDTKAIDGRVISYGAYDCIEETEEEHTASGYTNTIAKNINNFKESVERNGGYYMTRYEAGDSASSVERTSNSSQTVTPVFKNNQITYNCITQPNSAILMQNLYQRKDYESDLVNSYAWDTAIAFIQEFSGDIKYSRQQRLQNSLARTGQATDGTNKDARCNIYDMAGNVMEWSTETHKSQGSSVVRRGLDWYNPMYNEGASCRNMAGIDINSTLHGFRRDFIYNWKLKIKLVCFKSLCI